MADKPFPVFGDPDMHPDTFRDPYGYQVNSESMGEAYFNAPEANSTMVSDNIIMTQQLKKFVPKSSVKEGRVPMRSLMTPDQLAEENNRGRHYKSSYQ